MKNKNFRFACQILFYDCDQFILRTIENCAPHVEKIFITYSPLPWGYNPEAREKFCNPSDPAILQQSKFLDQVELIEGDWLTEEAQRNEVLDKAKGEGFDYLIIQDADEFYHADDYQRNLQAIEENPDYAFYKTPWYQFWKTTRYFLISRYSYLYRKGVPVQKNRNTEISYSMAFAINLASGNRFNRCRKPVDLDDYYVLPGICYHLSYVLSDEQVRRKIECYGHSGQIQHEYWYRYKWLGWREGSRSLHPIGPFVWLKAIHFKGELPNEIKDLPDPDQKYVPLTLSQRIYEILRNLIDLVLNYLKRLWTPIRAKIYPALRK